MTHSIPPPAQASAPPSPGLVLQDLRVLAACVAAQLAALEAPAVRPTLFLFAFLFSLRRAAARRRRIRDLRQYAALLAALAEAFAPAEIEPAAPSHAEPTAAADLPSRDQPRAARAIRSHPRRATRALSARRIPPPARRTLPPPRAAPSSPF